MCTNYNANQQPFVDKRSMENYEFANSGKPSQTFLHATECAKSVTPVDKLFVRTGEPPLNEDKRLYDLGIFNLATVGQQSSQVGGMGELWVAYEVEFFKPKYRGAVGSHLLGDHYQISLERGNYGTGPTGENPLGSLPLISRNTPSTIDNGEFVLGSVLTTGNTLEFPAYTSSMTFLVEVFIQANDDMGAAVAPTIGFNGPINYSTPAGWFDGGFTGTSTELGTVGKSLFHQNIVTIGNITDTIPTMTIKWPGQDFEGSAASLWTADIYITQINKALLNNINENNTQM